MAKEIELKLRVRQADFKLLEAQMQQLKAEPQGVRRLENTYFDTPELHLNQAKSALRLRFNAEDWVQTLKTSGTSLGALSERGEWEMPLAEGQLKLELFPEGLINPEWQNQLAPQFSTNFTRQTWVYKDATSTPPTEIELAADLGQVTLPSKKGRLPVADDALSELELELKQGNPASLFKLANRLAANLVVHLGVLSKAERGLRLLKGIDFTRQQPQPLLNKPSVSFTDLINLASQEVNQWVLAHENWAFNANEDEVLLAHRALLRLHALLVMAQRLCSESQLQPAIAAVKKLLHSFLPWVKSCWQDKALQKLTLTGPAAEWRSLNLHYALRRSEYRRLWYKNWVGQASLLITESLFASQSLQACTEENKAAYLLQQAIAKLGLPQQPMQVTVWLDRYPSLVRVELLLATLEPQAKENLQLIKQMQQAIEILSGYQQLLAIKNLPEDLGKQLLAEQQKLLMQLGRLAQSLWVKP
ncbi:inorganic triphosphatase [Marinospirillum minutulum]|uniref:CYTH domain-containing protein n=1 Tax=Marinospirillum minutulum TaxID=64974 RepID=UPI000416C517|nr:CYTH domain-containing protein [Marinospirillum minutulum]